MEELSDPYLEHAIGGTPLVPLKNLADRRNKIYRRLFRCLRPIKT